MARKATAAQKRVAKKYGIRVTKTIRGKRVEKTAEELKKQIETAKNRRAKAKAKAAKKRSTQTGSSVRKDDSRIVASTKAGARRSKKYATLTYVTKDPKTGKKVTKKVRRRNANQTGAVTGGRSYVERRANRTDKGTRANT